MTSTRIYCRQCGRLTYGGACYCTPCGAGAQMQARARRELSSPSASYSTRPGPLARRSWDVSAMRGMGWEPRNHSPWTGVRRKA